MTNKIVIAIDGFSSCGKSTLAKDLAKKIKYAYIDSGAMYRCVTLQAIRNNIIEGDYINLEKLNQITDCIDISFRYNEETALNETFLDGENVENDIRTLEVSSNVSKIAKIDFVREALVDLQQEMGENKGIVMDGRDIGTVVFPNAELKIFMTADVDVRTQRRYDELIVKDSTITKEQVKKNLEERDYIDQNRDISPLKQADDAIVLDNSSITKKEQLDWIINKIDELTA